MCRQGSWLAVGMVLNHCHRLQVAAQDMVVEAGPRRMLMHACVFATASARDLLWPTA